MPDIVPQIIGACQERRIMAAKTVLALAMAPNPIKNPCCAVAHHVRTMRTIPGETAGRVYLWGGKHARNRILYYTEQCFVISASMLFCRVRTQ